MVPEVAVVHPDSGPLWPPDSSRGDLGVGRSEVGGKFEAREGPTSPPLTPPSAAGARPPVPASVPSPIPRPLAPTADSHRRRAFFSAGGPGAPSTVPAVGLASIVFALASSSTAGAHAYLSRSGRPGPFGASPRGRDRGAGEGARTEGSRAGATEVERRRRRKPSRATVCRRASTPGPRSLTEMDVFFFVGSSLPSSKLPGTTLGRSSSRSLSRGRPGMSPRLRSGGKVGTARETWATRRCRPDPSFTVRSFLLLPSGPFPARGNSTSFRTLYDYHPEAVGETVPVASGAVRGSIRGLERFARRINKTGRNPIRDRRGKMVHPVTPGPFNSVRVPVGRTTERAKKEASSRVSNSRGPGGVTFAPGHHPSRRQTLGQVRVREEGEEGGGAHRGWRVPL